MLSLRVFGHELRKIWRFPLLAVIALFGVMSFYVFETNNFMKTQTWVTFDAELAFVFDLKAEFGTTLNYSEWHDAQRIINRYIAELDVFIADVPLFAEAGVYSAAELLEIEKEFHHVDFNELTETERARLSIVSFIPHDVYDVLLRTVHATETLENVGEHFRLNESTELNLFHGTIVRHKSDYFDTNIVIIIISVGILLLPYTIHDKQSNILPLQMTSRIGRRIVPIQTAAMMLSAFVLTSVMLAVYATLYFRENSVMLQFLNQPIEVVSEFRTYAIHFDLTYLQYLVILHGIVLLLALALAAFLFRLLINSRDYVSAILKAIPAVVFLSIFGKIATRNMFHEYNAVYDLVSLRGIEFILSGVLSAIGIGLCAFACKRVKRRDLL
jgi:hypothetical protein